MTTKIRVDMALLNGHDYVAIEEATGKPITDVLGTARGIYAAAWRARVRNGEPDCTFDDTMAMTLAAFEIVNADDTGNGDAGKAPGLGSGAPPPSSPGPGR